MLKSRRGFRVVIWLYVALALMLTACKPVVEIEPNAQAIAEISSAAGFLAARVEEVSGFIASDEKKSNVSDCAYLYDNAVAMIALANAGAQWHAQKIADAIVFAQNHDRCFHDGRLRNAYMGGDPKSDSGFSFTSGNVTIRLPGFWKDGRWQEDYYTVSTSTGNMAWAVMGLCAVAGKAAEDKQSVYIDAAVKMADFLLTMKSSEGGFTAGCEGWDEDQKKVTYKSTEHNIDLITAFKVIADAVSEKDPLKASRYREASDHAKDFVFSMYDQKLHCFYTGTEDDGKTISKGVIPLDANSLAILTFGEELDDVYDILSFIKTRIAVGSGFDFSAGDLDGIWNEGTAQMAICYSLLGDDERYEAIINYLNTQIRPDGSIPAADRDGVSTGFIISGSAILWEYNNTQSIGATSWFAFAQMKFNPLNLGSE